MEKRFALFVWFVSGCIYSFAQVDTSFIYNTSMPYGTLDLRLAKSESRYYFLEEGVTFSFRESSPGVRTNTFFDMTAWDSSPYSEGNLRERAGDEDLFVMNYRLMKPAGYRQDFSPGYPLIVLFHGAGERGNCWKSNCYHGTADYDPNENSPAAATDPDNPLLNNDHNLLHGGRAYMDAINLAGNRLPDDESLQDGSFPGFALFPQSLNGWSGDDAHSVIRIIRLLVKKYNIDEDRIYLTGLSYGGHGAFEALKRAPWMFAAGIMMSPIDDGFITNVKMEAAVAHVPLWVFQGALDENPNPRETKNFIKKFRDAGAIVRYTEYPETGHTTWYKAFREPDYFSWLLQHKKTLVHTFAGSAYICDGSVGRTLEFAEGFHAYQWQRNGSVIAGAENAKYTATSAGRYRGRFSRLSATPSESQWSEWSQEIELTTQEKPEARIIQKGTAMLRDLNNDNEARLEAAGDFAHYYWFRDGALIDFPGDQDDTLKSVVLHPGNCANGPCSGNGAYTLVTGNFDNCLSDPSEPIHVFFSDQAPLNITAPGDLAGKAQSPSSIKLTWKDNSANEGGFEIWRRRKSGTTLSPWEMSGLTGPGATSFVDTALIPSATYQYKVRAVSTSGRSDYFPKDKNTVVEVATAEDREPPSPPGNVRVKRMGVDILRLYWNPSVDDSGIREYRVTSGDQTISTRDTTVLMRDLAVNATYTFRVTSIDMGGNESAAIEAVTFTGVYGLFFGHSPGGWTSLDSIDFTRPEITGVVEEVTLREKIQEDYYYFRFDGFLYVTNAGSYSFRTISDDGSRLALDGVRIVNNDGIHEMRTVTSAARNLAAGPHRLTIDFFEYTGTDTLIVEYRGPDTGNAWAQMPAAALRSTLVVAVENPADPPGVNIFPNPVKSGELLSVELMHEVRVPITVSLVDAMGRIYFHNTFSPADVRDGIRLNTSLPAGLYVVEVVEGGKSVRSKLIIQR